MNIKLRFQNKATLLALIGACVAFLYQVLGILGVTAPISQDALTQLLGIVINLLVALGVVVDPTTAGIKDSALSMQKEQPESAEKALVSSMPSDTVTSSNDAYADPDISNAAVKQIEKMENSDKKEGEN
ncbi:MAG: phage holin [Pseudoramibacter sp.]